MLAVVAQQRVGVRAIVLPACMGEPAPMPAVVAHERVVVRAIGPQPGESLSMRVLVTAPAESTTGGVGAASAMDAREELVTAPAGRNRRRRGRGSCLIVDARAPVRRCLAGMNLCAATHNRPLF